MGNKYFPAEILENIVKRNIVKHHKEGVTSRQLAREYGLLANIRRLKEYKRTGDHIHRYENILNRDFSAQKPNMKWVTDISYIATKEGVLCLSMIPGFV